MLFEDIWNRMKLIEDKTLTDALRSPSNTLRDLIDVVDDRATFLIQECPESAKYNGDFIAYVATIGKVEDIMLCVTARMYYDERVFITACSRSDIPILRWYMDHNTTNCSTKYKGVVLLIGNDEIDGLKHFDVWISKSDSYMYLLTLCVEKNAINCLNYMLCFLTFRSKDLNIEQINKLIKLIFETHNYHMLRTLYSFVDMDHSKVFELEDLCEVLFKFEDVGIISEYIDCIADSYLFTNMNYIDIIKQNKLDILKCLLAEKKKRARYPVLCSIIPCSISEDDEVKILTIIANHANVEVLELLYDHDFIIKNDCRKILNINISNIKSFDKDRRPDLDSMKVINWSKTKLVK